MKLLGETRLQYRLSGNELLTGHCTWGSLKRESTVLRLQWRVRAAARTPVRPARSGAKRSGVGLTRPRSERSERSESALERPKGAFCEAKECRPVRDGMHGARSAPQVVRPQGGLSGRVSGRTSADEAERSEAESANRAKNARFF